ncbi:MAG: hypothetical protein PHF51_02375 [Candidatus ainarchaeum sp.]|nr:hypothetical protein [Candidatus ainarchaeum sp.]
MAAEPGKMTKIQESDEDACVTSALKCSYSYSPCPSCGVITSFSGRPRVNRKGSSDWCDAKAGIAVGTGDTVKICGKGSDAGKLRLVFYNSGIVQDAGPGTTFKFGQLALLPLPSAPKKVVVESFKGSLHFMVERGTEPFILSAGGFTALIRNADVLLQSSGGKMAFKLLDGKADVQLEAPAETASLSPGQMIEIKEGGKASAPQKFEPEKEDAWWADLVSKYPKE